MTRAAIGTGGHVTVGYYDADRSSMFMSNPSTMLLAALAGVMLTLYIMRRRTRLGKRAPKF
jgi:hypothetical protein